MLSKQANGRVLGFTPAWVIAYAKPGRGEQIAYNIRTRFGNQLNLIDFKVDRYELDALLTLHWDTATQTWDPTPPTCTTFDLTTNVTGTLPFANGGTGLSTLGTAGQALLVNSGATALEYGTAGITTGKAIAMAIVFGG
jgi:hypothetical protein